MQAAVITRYGGNENLEIRDLPDPQIRSGQVLVAIHAASVNPIDWKVGQGYFRLIPGQKMPCILGSDFSGVIEAVGAGVQGLSVGDEVMGLAAGGVGHTFAQRLAVSAKLVVKKPANLSHAEAASLPLVGATVLAATRNKVRNGDRVLIIGGSGGVGSFAVQYAKSLGAEVIATCSERNRQMVIGLGADQVIDYQISDPAEQVENIDLLFDTMGDLDPDHYWKCMVRGGVIGSTGSGPRDMHQLADKFGNYLWLMVGLGDALKQKFRGKRRHGVDYKMIFAMPSNSALREIARAAESGAVKPVIEQTFPLVEIKKAFELSQSGRVRGKLVINVT